MTLHFETLVQQAIEYPPKTKPFYVVHDDQQKGLLARVYKSGHAAYYIYLYDPVAKKKTYEKLGDFSVLPLEKARRTAADRIERVSGKAADNESYIQEKKQKTAHRKAETRRESVTLRKELDWYLANQGLSDASIRSYRDTISSELFSGDYLDKPVSKLTIDWFMERFNKIHARTPSGAFRWRRCLRAVLSATAERYPDLFPGKLPVASKRSLSNFSEPGRKSKRLEGSFFPELRRRLLELDDYDRDYLLIMLFTGMRSGAVMRLRYDMTCDQKNQKQWNQGVISVYDATEKRPATSLVVSDFVRRIILERKKKYGETSPWLFWSRQHKDKDPEKHAGNDQDIFRRLGAPDNQGGQITAHDLRRTNSYVSRAILHIDPVIVARLHLQSINNISVPDGYVSPSDIDLRREANRINNKMHEWMKSSAEAIEAEIHGGGRMISELPAFEL